MKNFILFIFLLFLPSNFFAQVVTTDPSLVTLEEPVTIYFNAAEGTGALAGFSGDIYAHTGVITNESSNSSDWKYVIAEWDENINKAKLELVEGDLYKMEIADIRQFYGVPDNEDIEQLAFVFRSSTGNLEGKDSGGNDIFITVYEKALTAHINKPQSGSLFLPDEEFEISGSVMEADGYKLFMNDDLLYEGSDESFEYIAVAPKEGAHTITLEAWRDDYVESASISFYIREDVTEKQMPDNLQKGVNIIDENSVTFVFEAPYTDYIYVLGDFNDWEPDPDYQMYKSEEFFWLTVDGLESDKEYVYQYLIDGELRLADAYTNKVLDPWHDRYITEDVYPGLIDYPTEYTDGLASVFNISFDEYQWEIDDFEVPANEDLVIYELLIRDFTEEGTINAVKDKLDYLEELGVNAIELMPFNQFEGNDSWGYNPSFFFATDKAYGTSDDYKAFIDECHKRGIAVIMDIVLNHTFSHSPLLQLYFDSDNDRAADNNPWYLSENNIQNPGLQWGYPFDHESEYTQALVDSVLAFWVEEYKIDGYRFDFTKGFTNTSYGPDSWASEYDADRITLLKRMVDQLREVKDDAIIIFEHLSDNPEEKELAEHGILMWGNMNHNFSEAVMGWHEQGKSDLSWGVYSERGWSEPNLVTYMESHDEERVMFKAQEWGYEDSNYSVRELPNALKRNEAAALILMTIPGPKMIWQFGERGYDVSIDDPHRLSPKPPLWNYMYDDDRESLYSHYATINHLKVNEPVFATDDFDYDLRGEIKRVTLRDQDNEVYIVANFDVEPRNVEIEFSRAGSWNEYFSQTPIEVVNNGDTHSFELEPGEYLMISENELTDYLSVNLKEAFIEEGNHKLLLYPLPANDVLNIESTDTIEELSIYDVNGRLIDKKVVNSSRGEINTTSFNRGFYILQTLFQSGHISQEKFFCL
ncbi:alpha-amylase family glycosyl hydrolase [Marinilabiliaceae bacterium ANBcel2]|nr:alpha-amylase family glycosyl hydrolase [Marinilabiliaceae bacterium ANBcel2]